MARVVVVRDQIHGVEQRLPALLGGDAIRTPTRVVVVESFLDCADGNLIRIGHGILVKVLVVNRFRIAAGAPIELRLRRPFGWIHPHVTAVTQYVAPAVHVLFFKDELKRARKRIGMRLYFRPNSPPVCARPFRFVKKEQHNRVVTISQVPRLLRIMTVNVIHIAIEVLGDAGSLVFLPLGALRREGAFVFHNAHVERTGSRETTA